LVTALSRLLTPLKFAISGDGALARDDPEACGAAATNGAAVEGPRGIRRTPRSGEADGDAKAAL
jgi:hypothetical protein